MSKIVLGTDYVLDDEPCLGLYEMNFKTPDQKGRHRYEIIQVLRDNKIVEYRRDLGAASKFKSEQLRIPGGFPDDNGRIPIHSIVETVGRLRDIAINARKHKHDKLDFLKLDKCKD